jgi:RNA polymerase sigma-70 factor (ECF subfamily)
MRRASCRNHDPETGPAGSEADSTPPSSGDASLDALAEAVAASDPDAFEIVFRRLSERIFRYVRGMTGSEATAHDVTQDTFARLWTHRRTLEEVDHLTSYVFQIARRRVYNLHRDRRVRRENEGLLRDGELSVAPDAPDADVDTDLLQRQLDAWIDELPDRQREAITLSRMDGLSHEAIARVMDISPNTVNAHIVKAMKHLRSRLREHRPDLLS